MSLGAEQLERYNRDGFLSVPDLFEPRELAPVIGELEALVDGIARTLRERGHIRDTHGDKDFATRLAALNRDFPGAAVLAALRGRMGPALAALWASDRLLDIVEQLIGPDIDGHPNWVLRPKTPATRLMTVPWHQDAAYFTPDAETTFIPTAWIPLVDATRENGALQFLRGAHKPPRYYHHRLERRVPGNDDSWYVHIDDADVGTCEVVTCEAPLGSVVLHSNLIPHRSTENHSDTVRWAADFRWVEPGLPLGIDMAAVPMRRAGRRGLRPDFEAWARRFEEKWHERHARADRDELEVEVDGIWMERWARTPVAGPRWAGTETILGAVPAAYG